MQRCSSGIKRAVDNQAREGHTWRSCAFVVTLRVRKRQQGALVGRLAQPTPHSSDRPVVRGRCVRGARDGQWPNLWGFGAIVRGSILIDSAPARSEGEAADGERARACRVGGGGGGGGGVRAARGTLSHRVG